MGSASLESVPRRGIELRVVAEVAGDVHRVEGRSQGHAGRAAADGTD